MNRFKLQTLPKVWKHDEYFRAFNTATYGPKYPPFCDTSRSSYRKAKQKKSSGKRNNNFTRKMGVALKKLPKIQICKLLLETLSKGRWHGHLQLGKVPNLFNEKLIFGANFVTFKERSALVKTITGKFWNAIPRSQEDEIRWVPTYTILYLPRSPLQHGTKNQNKLKATYRPCFFIWKLKTQGLPTIFLDLQSSRKNRKLEFLRNFKIFYRKFIE
jgi:hypothetical protein